MSHPPGQRFGKYQLLDRIAAGGMAEIYRARYEGAAGVTKPVVIKKILPHYAGNKSFVSMFVNEAKIAVGLSHGNIAQVFDFGEIDGEFFLAMEFVDGQPLSKVMRRAREKGIPVIPTPFAVYIALELSKGLHYAHTRLDDTGRPLRIVHRDISPQNVILSYEGQVKIVDFGIAKARTAGRTETQAGAVKGKYVYFAPEQARGLELDGRTDLFAAGICLFEMICGRLPFEGRMVDVLTRITGGEFQRPRGLNPDITPALERILLTALANDRNVRYDSAQSMQEALAQYLYANAPTFSSASLAQLMSYLYEPELLNEGRPIQLRRDFVEQVPLWRKKLPDPASVPIEVQPPPLPLPSRQRPGSEAHSDVSVTPTVTAEPTAPNPDFDPTPSSPSTQPRAPRFYAPGTTYTQLRILRLLGTRWNLLLIPVTAALVAAALVLVFARLGTFTVQLTSEPTQATVYIDGELAPTLTPLRISDLPADRDHVLELRFPGFKPKQRSISPARGVTLPVHVELEPETAPLRPDTRIH